MCQGQCSRDFSSFSEFSLSRLVTESVWRAKNEAFSCREAKLYPALIENLIWLKFLANLTVEARQLRKEGQFFIRFCFRHFQREKVVEWFRDCEMSLNIWPIVSGRFQQYNLYRGVWNIATKRGKKVVAIFPTALQYFPRGCNISNIRKIAVLEFS